MRRIQKSLHKIETLPVYTIGHSTRTIPDFVALLRAGGVQTVVDVRRLPRSRTNPQYNLETLPGELAPYQIGHVRIAELGGLRKKSVIPSEVNDFWINRSFHNYADYALTDAFRVGVEQLLEISAEHRTAIMCAEAVWWRCHRRIIADYLIHAGRTVYNLMNTYDVSLAEMTKSAIPAVDGLHYPNPSDAF